MLVSSNTIWYTFDKMFERNINMVLDNIECGKFTVDKFFDVRYGSEKYFEYIGREAYRALQKLLYSDDVERFNAFFETVKEHWKGISVRIKRADDVYRDAYIKVRKKAKIVCGEQLWDMEFYDIDTLTHAYENVNDRIGRYKTLLGMVNVDYFCYEHGKGETDFIRIVNGQERLLYSVSLDELRRAVACGHVDKADEDILISA